MKKLSKVFIPVVGTFALVSAVSGIVVLSAKNGVKNNDIIEIDNFDDSLVRDYQLGSIAPGGMKEQKFMVSSKVDLSSFINLSIEMSSNETAADYISVTASLGDETLETRKMSACLNENLSFSKKLNANEKKEMVIVYSLADDIPEEIIDSQLDFSIVLKAKVL